MLLDKGDEKRPPKTRFSSRDRSKEARATCIPRLKSFPAEKIKKLNNSPAFSSEQIGVATMQQDPREVFLTSSPPGINCDRDDTVSVELSQAHQQFKPSCATVPNQQQVVPYHQQTDQTCPHSDSSHTRQIGSPAGQVQRALAANVYQKAILRDRSAQNPLARGTKRAFERSSCVLDDRNCDGATVFEDEEQPVGGRNAAHYIQMIMQKQQQQQDASQGQGVRFQEDHRPIYQQPQHETYHQQMSQAFNHAPPMFKQQQQMHNNPGTPYIYQNQRLSSAQLAPVQGMTSPQDLTMSQMRLTRHNQPMYQQNLGYPVGQGAWPPDGRWTSYNQQHSCQQQAPPPPQWGCYCQDAQNSGYTRQLSELIQDQPVPSRHQTSYDKAAADLQQPVEAHARQNDRKSMLQFTADMIRDQELLVTAMRQQGVPHDVMRRQFDALLNEQRKHLAYVAQFQRQADAPEVKRTCRLVSKRRPENDEKPEWMVRITPPRVSYNDLERMRVKQRASSERQTTADQATEDAGRTMPAQQPYRQPREETIAQVASPQRTYLRMNPHQWQQQAANWPLRSNFQRPSYGYASCYPYGRQQSVPNIFYRWPSFNGLDQSPQQGFQYQYPYNAPHISYQAHPEQQKLLWPEEKPNATSTSSTGKQAASAKAVHEHLRSERPTEPSSLLKMRVYKNVIQPQKRNNGLQDLNTVQKALEALKDSTSKKGLEYLANLAKRKVAVIKLNGAQEADEIPEDLRQRPISLEDVSRLPKKVSANGLENERNPDNPAPRVLRPRTLDEPATKEYPRQRQSQNLTYYGASTETTTTARSSQQRDDHAAAVSLAQDAGPMSRDQATHLAPTPRARTANNAVVLPYGGAPLYQRPQLHARNFWHEGGEHLARHNGGQGDGIASTRRPHAPGARGIDRAGSDALAESSSADGAATKKHGNDERSIDMGTGSYGRTDIRPARSVDCAAVRFHVPNGLAVSPDTLLASKQPPMIF
ncbi:hypothetical protein EAI_16670 [Harpegnathos saltator]|uniref:Uncharacterized protein n=1 Tax=Harpegnathos saltator TaxID=610380 RepID=E2BEQ1_HARSA|nr:hypothetical protein EAI_16670 [Harpegnathos saltator]